MLHKIIGRLMKLLSRRGVLIEAQGSTYLADSDAESDDAQTLRPLRAAACTYRVASEMPACRSSPQPSPAEPSYRQRKPARLSWARLLKRVFEIDLQHCPNCGGKLKLIAPTVEAPLIGRTLTHLGLQARAPPRAPARGYMLHAA